MRTKLIVGTTWFKKKSSKEDVYKEVYEVPPRISKRPINNFPKKEGGQSHQKLTTTVLLFC